MFKNQLKLVGMYMLFVGMVLQAEHIKQNRGQTLDSKDIEVISDKTIRFMLVFDKYLKENT